MKKKKMPEGLKKQGAAFWQKANMETIFEDSHDVQRLMMAAKSLDEIDAAENEIKKSGMIVKDRYGGLREHPAVKIIRDNRILFCRIVRELGLDFVAPNNSGLPRQY